MPQRARHDEQERRAVHEHEAHVPPRVTEAVQLRLADARAVDDRHLFDLQAALRRLDHHLRGELHAGAREAEPRDGVAPDRPQPAVRVGDAGAKEHVQHPGQDRVADPAVRPRHRALHDRPLHPGPHHQVGAAAEPLRGTRRARRSRTCRPRRRARGSGPAPPRARRGTRCRSRGAAPSRRARRQRARARRSRPPMRCRRRRPLRRRRARRASRTPSARRSRSTPPR